jgi:serine protease Do
MNKKQLILTVVLVSFLSAALSLLGYKFFLEPRSYQSTDLKTNARFSNFFDKDKAVVPEGLNFIYAANYVTPAVVHVKTYYEASVHPGGGRGNFQQSPFDEFFRDFFEEQQQGQGRPQQPQGPQQQAAGSGVILSADGYIVTNNHVIENADKIEVTLNNKKTYTATLVGADPTTDLAVLKIEATDLPSVQFANSDDVQIGEWVLAVGNPFNLTSTVTAGIVSAKARNINILHDKDNLAIESFIQTDAAVNPGNSGGALVNLKGELIGVNTAIATPTGTYAGYSFAVPSALVKKVVGDLKEFGTVQRALLGVTIMDVTSELAKEKGIAELEGVYVAGVREGSAGERAGLKEGDVITKINEVKVNSSSELQEQVARFRPGDKVKVSYIRKGDLKVVDAELQNKLGETALIKKEEASLTNAMGAQLVRISKEEMRKLKIENGVKVVKVNSGKLKSAGIKDGFIIISVDKKPVENPDDVINMLEIKKGAVLIEGVYPDGRKDYFAIG